MFGLPETYNYVQIRATRAVQVQRWELPRPCPVLVGGQSSEQRGSMRSRTSHRRLGVFIMQSSITIQRKPKATRSDEERNACVRDVTG